MQGKGLREILFAQSQSLAAQADTEFPTKSTLAPTYCAHFRAYNHCVHSCAHRCAHCSPAAEITSKPATLTAAHPPTAAPTAWLPSEPSAEFITEPTRPPLSRLSSSPLCGRELSSLPSPGTILKSALDIATNTYSLVPGHDASSYGSPLRRLNQSGPPAFFLV